MKKVRIVRLESTEQGVRGVLYVDSRLKCVTFEDPWKENAPNVSCIPTGTYRCKRVLSPKFGPTFEVEGVPGRSLIRFHGGLDQSHTEGCILVGMWFDPTKVAIGPGGGKVLIRFMELFKGENEFDLQIVDCALFEPLPLVPCKL